MTKNEIVEEEVGGFYSMVKVGHPVPDFEFEVFHNEEIKKVRFSDYTGKWLVLFFYPADFTFVCPTELEELARHYPECAKLDAEVISVSTDTVFAHKVWHDSSESIKNIEFPMAADPSGRLSIAFGTYIDGDTLDHTEDEGLSLRGTFIIDPDGILRAMEVNDNSIGRSARELVRRLKAAQYVRTHGGQVCPASWEEGGDALEPGLEKVGKI